MPFLLDRDNAFAVYRRMLLEYCPDQPRDESGRWSKVAANIKRGQAALEYALKTQEDVPDAMFRDEPEIGDITFVWGEPGNPDIEYKDGYGLSHILAHPEGRNIWNIPTVIAKGDILKPKKKKKPDIVNRYKVHIFYNGFIVALTKGGKGVPGTWVLTGYGSNSLHKDKQSLPVDEGEVISVQAYARYSSGIRNNVGAGDPKHYTVAFTEVKQHPQSATGRRILSRWTPNSLSAFAEHSKNRSQSPQARPG
jgi:hypothetical protein